MNVSPLDTVVQTQKIEAAMAFPIDNLDDLAEKADLVILGNVASTESFELRNGSIWTKETIQVLDTLMGSTETGTVEVYRMGGKVSVDDYVASFDESIRSHKKQQYSNFAGNDLIEQVLYEDDSTAVDTQKILFLRGTTLFENAYEPVGDYMGMFCADGQVIDHILEKPVDNEKASPSNAGGTKNVTVSTDGVDFNGHLGSFSFDDFQNATR